MQQEIKVLCDLLLKAGRSRGTVRSYQYDLHLFRRFLLARGHALTPGARGIRTEGITEHHIREYVTQLRKKAKASTVERRIIALRMFFWHRGSRGLRNPARFLSTHGHDRPIPSILSEKALAQLIEASAGVIEPAVLRDRAIMEVLRSTGLLVSELVGLNWKDIKWELGTIEVRGKRARSLVLQESAMAALRAWQAIAQFGDDPEKAVFVSRRLCRLTARSIEMIVAIRAKEAGIAAHVTPRGLRHSFAASMFERGNSLGAVQEILGHTSLTTTRRYEAFRGLRRA